MIFHSMTVQLRGCRTNKNNDEEAAFNAEVINKRNTVAFSIS